MADLTPADHVALELCPQYVTCAGCARKVEAFGKLIDERIAAAHAPVHEFMRGWARQSEAFYAAPARREALRDVLEVLRKVVGREDAA